MTRVSFLAELAYARAGDQLVYHTGFLMVDRMFGPTFQNVHAIATAVMDAYQEGRVHLVQKRVTPGVCAYIAIKRPAAPHLRADQKAGSHYVNKNRSTNS